MDLLYPLPTRTTIRATRYRKGRLRPVRLIVLHDMEAPETGTTAEAVGRYFASLSAGGSTHVGVDTDSICRYVDDADTCAGAPGVNADGRHIEQAGFARQTREEWLDDPSKRVIENAAIQSAEWSVTDDIPLVWLTAEQIRDGKSRGFITHADATVAFQTPGGHTDPGPGYPRDYFMQRVAFHVARLRRRGVLLSEDGILDDGTRRAIQRMVRATADSDWGPKTWTALQAWAGLRGKDVDGIPGPVTTKAIALKVGRPDLADAPWSHAWTMKPTALTRAIEAYYNRAVRNGTAHWI